MSLFRSYFKYLVSWEKGAEKKQKYEYLKASQEMVKHNFFPISPSVLPHKHCPVVFQVKRSFSTGFTAKCWLAYTSQGKNTHKTHVLTRFWMSLPADREVTMWDDALPRAGVDVAFQQRLLWARGLRCFLPDLLSPNSFASTNTAECGVTTRLYQHDWFSLLAELSFLKYHSVNSKSTTRAIPQANTRGSDWWMGREKLEGQWGEAPGCEAWTSGEMTRRQRRRALRGMSDCRQKVHRLKAACPCALPVFSPLDRPAKSHGCHKSCSQTTCKAATAAPAKPAHVGPASSTPLAAQSLGRGCKNPPRKLGQHAGQQAAW